MATVESEPQLTEGQVRSGLTEVGIVLEGVSWQTYERLLAGLGDRRVFVTYDRGTMEIQLVSPSYKHENDDRLLERLVYAISLLADVPLQSGGSVTIRREDLERGVEPDACFWIASVEKLRGVTELDLTKHPAPDLAIEIDVHADSIDRIDAYRKLGVREVWWLPRGESLRFLELNDSGEYDEAEVSRNLPMVRRDVLAEALEKGTDRTETERLNELLTILGLR